MSLFNNYRTGLESVLGRKQDFIEKGLKGPYALLNESRKVFSSVPATIAPNSKTILEFDSNQLERYFGPNRYSFDNVTIGNHPDFQFLGENQTIKHHCVSMFVDIKGSTQLQLKYTLEEVRLIKDTLLTLCINIVTHFGGHVHRLQGDAVFAQFVRRDKNPNNSIINALNAGSVICQAVSEDLSAAFEAYGLDPIKIRVGIDYGPDDKVMWSHYGIDNCNELTTTSIHTDLAAKLQHKASNNSIRIGKNIVEAIEMRNDYISTPKMIKNGDVVEDRYILQSSNLNYRQFDFNWKKYLKSFSFYKENGNGKLELKDDRYTLAASIYDKNDEDNAVQYFENNFAIPKDKKIRFELRFNNVPYYRKPNERIRWEVYNYGQEAKLAEDERNNLENYFDNKNYCCADTVYHGNHYLKCTITRGGFLGNVIIKFPIYVDDKVDELGRLKQAAMEELKNFGMNN